MHANCIASLVFHNALSTPTSEIEIIITITTTTQHNPLTP
jgi:hypothetical protein